MSSNLLNKLIRYRVFLVLFLIERITSTEKFEYENRMGSRSYLNYQKRSELDNDVTGTGNKLKDIAYISACMSLQCEFVCCKGSINEMKCGDKQDCMVYRNKKIKKEIMNVVLTISPFYILIPVFWIISKCAERKENYKVFLTFSKILNVYMCLLLPPYGIVVLLERIFKKNGSSEESKSSRLKGINGIGRNSRANQKLFQCKEFIVSDFENGAKENYDERNNISNYDDELVDVEIVNK